MKLNTDDLLTEAVARTDAEIFASAMDEDEPGEDADRSLEDMGDGLEGNPTEAEGEADEGDEPADGETDESEAEGEDAEGEGEEESGEEGEQPKTPPADEPELRGLPKAARDAIVAERRARQAAEAALETQRTESRTEIAAINARLDRALAAIEKPTPKPADQPAVVKPDPVLDPDGYERHVLAQAEQRAVLRRVAETFEDAHAEHGKEFEAANAALSALDRNNPVDRATVQRIAQAGNPGRALMKWHRDQVMLREVGGDPAGYRERIRAELLKDPEVRKQVIAGAREEARRGAGDGKPNTITRIPRSLNSARGGGAAGEADPSLSRDNSDKAVFDYAMND